MEITPNEVNILWKAIVLSFKEILILKLIFSALSTIKDIQIHETFSLLKWRQ